jgi:hypothetical protein
MFFSCFIFAVIDLFAIGVGTGLLGLGIPIVAYRQVVGDRSIRARKEYRATINDWFKELT